MAVNPSKRFSRVALESAAALARSSLNFSGHRPAAINPECFVSGSGEASMALTPSTAPGICSWDAEYAAEALIRGSAFFMREVSE